MYTCNECMYVHMHECMYEWVGFSEEWLEEERAVLLLAGGARRVHEISAAGFRQVRIEHPEIQSRQCSSLLLYHLISCSSLLCLRRVWAR